ncbi:MAG: allophanate hydrolase [Deltaproteobacteria bacterium]|nr:MAG: allophanate hydrolase [Deltaproteobacteria bacterium]
MGEMQVMTEGFLSTVQDQGRSLCQHLGLAEAGALDKQAFFWGNRLLGNACNAPAVEILLGNCSFSFNAPTRIAITGASMAVTLNDEPVAGWTTLAVQAGDILRCGCAQKGLRAYLCIVGGFTVPRFFGSSATVLREKTGANAGEKLGTGDLLCYPDRSGLARQDSLVIRRVPERYIPDYETPLILEFFPGYHYNEFDADSVQRFLHSWYTITQDADRMGYRLAGSALKREGDNILSIGVPCGAIQVPTAGEPIILLNDRQCTGGYPVLGVVAARDIFQLAQRKPGDKVRFVIADLERRRQELCVFSRFFEREAQ